MAKAKELFMGTIGLMPIAAGAVSPQPTTGGNETQTPRPNIIYIMCDDMGYGDLGCYGQQLIETPNIDRMAQEGMRFTQAYAGSPVSAPSRASFMTGQHTGHTHVRGNREYWNKALVQNAFGNNADYSIIGQEPYLNTHKIIPEIMKEAGYATGMFGKWAGGYYNLQYPDVYILDADGNTDTSKSTISSSASLPNLRGIDCYYGPICQFQAHTYYPNFLNRYDPEKYGDKYVVVDILKQNILHSAVASGNKDYENREQYSSDLIHQYALDWIDRQTDEQPFLGIFTYTLPHAELWQPNDSLVQKYTEKFQGQDGTFGGNFGSWYYRNYGKHAQFAAMVSRLDAQVGEIMDKLKEKGFDDNTLVIFTSDNGPHEEGGADPSWFNRDGLLKGLKRSTYEGGIRIPFIAKGPGVPAGTVNDHLLAFYDLMPTFMDYAGLDGTPYSRETSTEENCHDGISFYNTLVGNDEEQEQHEFLYWEFHETNMMAVRMGDWKLVVNKGNVLLYDLASDIHEDHDVAAQHPDIVAQMVEVIYREHKDSPLFNVTLPERRMTGEYITMTFTRPQSGSPIVTMSDEKGKSPAGVSSSVVSIYPEQATTNWTGAAVSGRTDLSPGTNATGTKRNITFRIDGLPSNYAIKQFTAGIAATNASGEYQGYGTDRDFTFTMQTSTNGSQWADYGTLSGNINKTVGGTTKWEFTNTNDVLSPTNPFYLRLQLVNNSDLGCYSSLFSMTLHRNTDVETATGGVSTETSLTSTSTYDLSGRPASPNAQGVLVKDGKLVMNAPAPAASME